MSNDDEVGRWAEGREPPPEIVAFREWAEILFPSCSDYIRKGNWDDSLMAIAFISGMRWVTGGGAKSVKETEQ